MAIGDAYATSTEYKAVVGKTATGADTVIDRQLLTCSRFFERETGQFFNKDASAVARVFVAKYSDLLDLTYEGNCPGIADTTGLQIKVDTDGDGLFTDETAWATTDYDLLPLQAQLGPESKPYTQILVAWPPRGNSSKSFVPGAKVQVTAIFGWPAVPSAVKDDVIELCAIWRKESPTATGRINELDQIVMTSPMAASLVSRIRDQYRARITF